ncbi:MAG: S26 family signal peptidase, partial [Mycobacteriales bacterium]
GRLWVMGDHRSASDDSRCKIQDGEFGTVSTKDVIGKAFVTIWPPSRWRTLGTPSTFHRVPSPGSAEALLPTAPTGPDPVTLAGLLLTPVLYRKGRARRAAPGGTGPPAVSGGRIG